MGNFSRNTFNQLKNYVGVRLQQGVPIVDADWNEQEDIRKHELRTFLKWFVGNGVPKGNDGFRIVPLDGSENDFTIKGGDGTNEGAGRCLVEGWDVLIVNDVKYSEQRLPSGEDPLGPLSPPLSGERTDTVYLDIWEREVDAQEDENLVNQAIGIETCVRLKREWVVRVAEGADEPPNPSSGHVYYPLALLKRTANQNAIGQEDITDLRRTGLAVLSKEITIKDGNVGIGTPNPSFGDSRVLEINGEPRPVIRLVRPGGSEYIIGTEDVDDKLRIVNSAGVSLPRESSKGIIIDTQGKMGIGTPSPDRKLHVNGTMKISRPGNEDRWTTDNHSKGIELENGTSIQFLKGGVGSSRGISGNVGKLYFMRSSADDNSAAATYDMVIDADGKVGIGIQEPKTELDVNGDLNVTGGLSSRGGQVRRDFLTWNTTAESGQPIHIKTNIPRRSCVMYRFLVEGYNYGIGAAICSDVVGYTWVQPDEIIHTQTNNYANGVSISQYYSSDGFVVIKLTTTYAYYIGFSVSAWFTNPTGKAFDISASVVQQANDL